MQQLNPTTASLFNHSLFVLPEDFIEEDLDAMRKIIHRMTVALVESCRSCIMIQPDPSVSKPILCARTPTHSHPTWVNVDQCLSCGAFRQP